MYKNVLVPIDGSATATRGLCEAIKFAKNQGATIRLFHMMVERVLDCGYGVGTYGAELVASAREEGQHIMAEAQRLARSEGVEPETVLVDSMGDTAAASIIEQARKWPADLIVMGTHGRHGVVRLAIGSDAECVLRKAPVPILLVRNILQEDHPINQNDGSDASTHLAYA